MYHHRLVISYKGTRYFGWQDLGTGEEKPTVQASIHQILKKICKYQSCTISAASRTDSGVHAQGQVAKITIAVAIESEKQGRVYLTLTQEGFPGQGGAPRAMD